MKNEERKNDKENFPTKVMKGKIKETEGYKEVSACIRSGRQSENCESLMKDNKSDQEYVSSQVCREGKGKKFRGEKCLLLARR